MTDNKDNKDKAKGHEGSERPSTMPDAPGQSRTTGKPDDTSGSTADTGYDAELDRIRQHDKGREQDPRKHSPKSEVAEEDKTLPVQPQVIPPPPNPGAAQHDKERGLGGSEQGKTHSPERGGERK